MNRFDLDYNSFKLREQRKALRKNMTRAEVYLWNYLRRKQIKGIRFRRQFSIDTYVVDFFAPKIKLVIEVDGLTHVTKEEIEYDNCRQIKLESMGITFLRFTNIEIYYSLETVLASISSKIEELENIFN